MDHEFSGMTDPNRVSLEKVFPYSGITFSTCLRPFGPDQYPYLYIEGGRGSARPLKPFLRQLVRSDLKERCFGVWTGFLPLDRGRGFQLIYDPDGLVVNNLQLLEFVLLRHLIVVCRLRTSLIPRIVVVKNGRCIFERDVAIPFELWGEGQVDLPVERE